MSDLVKRLRAYAKDQGGWHNIDETCEEAATRIEQLEAENARLVKALTALVSLNDDYSPFMGEIGRDRIERTWERARDALAGKAGE